MPKIERNVVKPPNEDRWKRSDERENGFLSLADQASPVNGPNQTRPGDWRGGSYPLGGSGSPISPPNNMGGDRRGYSSDGEMPAAVEPGKGAIAINPTTGLAIGTMPIADMAPPGGPTK